MNEIQYTRFNFYSLGWGNFNTVDESHAKYFQKGNSAK